MNTLLIVGAGGHGRCCLDIARNMNIFDKISFLDDNHVDETINDCKVIGLIDEMSSYYPEYTHIHIAIGNNQIRSQLFLQAKAIGYSLPVLQHSTSVISKYASIKEGTVIFPHAVVEANASINRGCILASNVVVNHDANIDEFNLINTSSVIRPNSIIGRFSKINSHCVVSFGTKVNENSDIPDGTVIQHHDDESWKEEYKKQTGEDVSYF